MTLPEPQFIERDVNKITQEWITLYEQKTGKTLQPAQIERILIDVGVYRESLLRIGIQEAAKQNLVNFATYPMLDYLGELVGVYRIPAKASITTIKFSLSEIQSFNVLIPEGSQIESKDGKVIFKTLSDILILAGQLSAEIQAEAETVGSIANGYLAGEVKNLITPISYIESAENTAETTGGADEEDDEALRERVKQAPEKFTNAGSRGAYRYWAITAHQDIIDVAVLSSSPGIVKIYPLTKFGSPTGDILSRVQNILSNDKVRPLTDQVIVESPQKIDFEIKGSVTLYSYADAQSVEAETKIKLDKYIAELKSKLGKDIVPTQIIAILNSIYGVYSASIQLRMTRDLVNGQVFKVDLNIPNFTEILEYQWANCTGYQIDIAGYTNG
jgi:phage-related baseplate assembly protein